MSAVSPTHSTTPPKVVPLLNSVVDVCLVYGIDETSARELPITEEGVRERREGNEREGGLGGVREGERRRMRECGLGGQGGGRGG